MISVALLNGQQWRKFRNTVCGEEDVRGRMLILDTPRCGLVFTPPCGAAERRACTAQHICPDSSQTKPPGSLLSHAPH